MKKIMLIAVMMILFLLPLFSGCITYDYGLLDILPNGTTTISYRRGLDEWAGNYQYELLGPNARKGYICSYRDNGMSESITVHGSITKWNHELPWSSIAKIKYLVYLKENAYDSWEDTDNRPYSEPGKTSEYISPGENPGEIQPDSTSYPGYLYTYEFQLVGNRFSKGAIKVELWAYFDLNPTITDIGGPGQEWYLMASDEAYLYEGWGGLTFDTDNQGLPINTYEIGETGRIHVETTYGGQTAGVENKPWEVIMRYPEDRGGGILKQQTYGDMVKTYFEFTVTQGMFSKSSNNEYKITLYNTILPQAEILTRTIDLKANAPGDVVYSGATQVKNGDYINIKLSATVNPLTQLPISYFRIGVYYGGKDSTIPTDPLSERWIIPVNNYYNIQQSANEYSATINFKPDKPQYEGFICVWAVAYDTEGRGSLHSEKYVINIWVSQDNGGSGQPPDETIHDEVGQDHDYGGHSENWLPWDPSGGNWEDQPELQINTTGLIIAIVIIVIFIILAFLIPGLNPLMRTIIIIIGIAIAIIQYLLFFI